MEPLHDTGFACQARFTFCNPIPIDPNLKESTKPVMLRPVYGKNIVYHCLRQGNRIACFRVKLMETINKNWVPKNGYYCFTRLFLWAGGFPYINYMNQIGEYLYFTYLKRLVKQLLVLQVYETPQMQVVTCVHGTTSSLQASEIGGRWERSPGKVNHTKWLVLRMIHGSRIPDPTKWAVRLVDLDGLPG